MNARTGSVVYVANSGMIGGANRVLMDMVEGAAAAGWEVAIVVPHRGPLTEWCAERQLPHHVVPARGGSALAQAARIARLARYFHHRQAQIVHAIDPACYRESGFASALLRIRRICHVQFPPGPEALRWALAVLPDYAITCYEGHVTEMAAALPAIAPRLISLPNAVRLDVFKRTDGSGSEAYWKFGRKHMVAIVGHLSELKGYPTFIRAARHVLERHPDTSFVALGGETIQAGFQAVLERLATDLGVREHIYFLGWRKEVRQVLSVADVFALPSQKEGLPLSLLEAMACQLPVVATPVNGVPEVIQHGHNGLLVPVDDPEALAAAIIGLLSTPDRARRLAIAGRATVERRYSMAAFIDRMLDIYERLIPSGQPPSTRNRDHRHYARVVSGRLVHDATSSHAAPRGTSTASYRASR